MSDDQPMSRGKELRNYLIAGLLVWIPLVVTIFVFKFLVDLMDQTLLLLPTAARPEQLLGFHIPGLGVVLTVVVLLGTGLTVRNLFGRQLVEFFEKLIKRTPIVGPVYSGAKSFSETVLTNTGQSFRKTLLVEYPRKGIWTLGFQTSDGVEEFRARTGRDLVCVFIPTTPNPTSGFIMLVPREEVIELDMEVDAAVKMIFTLGVVVPRSVAQTEADSLAPQQRGS